jgi:hypothetical protein
VRERARAQERPLEEERRRRGGGGGGEERKGREGKGGVSVRVSVRVSVPAEDAVFGYFLFKSTALMILRDVRRGCEERM